MAIEKPAQGSTTINAIAEIKDANGNPIVVPLVLDTTYNPPRLLIELPDRALRDLGIVDAIIKTPNGDSAMDDANDAVRVAIVSGGGIASALPAGDNNIGNVDIASALPAGTNLLGRTSASLDTSTIYNGTTALTPKFAVIDDASSGDNTIVTAVTSKKIRVLAAFLVSAGTATVRFESGAGGTALTGQMSLVANTGFVLPFNPVGWFETAAEALLNLELSAGVSVDGSIVYVEV